MAVDFQAKDFTAKTFPYTQPASFNETRFGAVPWGQAIVNESFQTTTVGAGNEGLISIDIGLPSDYVALLRNFHLQVVDTAAIYWDEAIVGFAYQQPGGPYKESVTDYPEDEYSWYQLVSDGTTVRDRFSADRYLMNFTWGFNTVTSSNVIVTAGLGPTNLPLWVPPSADANFLERTVIVFVENKIANQPAQEMTIRCSFDLFTFEQAYSAAVMSSPRVFT